jgi:transcriptional regulator with XRE-family HTH domain
MIKVKTLGDLLLDARKHAGLSRQKVAEEIGTREWRIEEYEFDEKIPKPETIHAMLRIYGVDEISKGTILDKRIGVLNRRHKKGNKNDEEIQG